MDLKAVLPHSSLQLEVKEKAQGCPLNGGTVQTPCEGPAAMVQLASASPSLPPKAEAWHAATSHCDSYCTSATVTTHPRVAPDRDSRVPPLFSDRASRLTTGRATASGSTRPCSFSRLLFTLIQTVLKRRQLAAMPLISSDASPTSLTIRRPDDFHVHFRDEEMLKVVAPYTARNFARAIVMPNLQPPVCTAEHASAYRQRIKRALPTNPAFQPLMTLYLTDNTTPEIIRQAHATGFVKACKLYPAGATTNSASGVTAVENVFDALETMQQLGMVLCVHGESTEANVEIFDREHRFIEATLPMLLQRFPTLKIVLEHVTTSEAVQIVKHTPGNRLAATITAHHLLYSLQAIFAGAKIRPAMFCLPILKREVHRQALLRAIADDDQGKFFAGTDSAPHLASAKFCSAGCAGIFSAHAAIELYAEAFEEAGCLEKLEAFISEHGARFYGLPLNEGSITLIKQSQTIASKVTVPGLGAIVPLRAGEQVQWSIHEVK